MHKLKIAFRLAPVRLVLTCASLAALLAAGCTPGVSVARQVATQTPALPGLFPQTAGTKSAAESAAAEKVATIVAQTMQARPALPTATVDAAASAEAAASRDAAASTVAASAGPASTQPNPPANPPTDPAPSLVPSPTPVLLEAGCLVGTWEVTNLADSVSPPQAAEGLAVQNITGRVVYIFDANGSLAITFDQLNAALNGTVNKRKVNAVESFNGSALASYQVDAPKQQIILSNFGGEGIQVGVDINGQRLAEGNLPAWQAFTSGPSAQQANSPVQSSRAQVICGGSALTIHVVDPVGGPELHLVRK